MNRPWLLAALLAAVAVAVSFAHAQAPAESALRDSAIDHFFTVNRIASSSPQKGQPSPARRVFNALLVGEEAAAAALPELLGRPAEPAEVKDLVDRARTYEHPMTSHGTMNEAGPLLDLPLSGSSDITEARIIEFFAAESIALPPVRVGEERPYRRIFDALLEADKPAFDGLINYSFSDSLFAKFVADARALASPLPQVQLVKFFTQERLLVAPESAAAAFDALIEVKKPEFDRFIARETAHDEFVMLCVHAKVFQRDWEQAHDPAVGRPLKDPLPKDHGPISNDDHARLDGVVNNAAAQAAQFMPSGVVYKIGK